MYVDMTNMHMYGVFTSSIPRKSNIHVRSDILIGRVCTLKVETYVYMYVAPKGPFI